jgi:hypothetical protein
VTDPTYAGPSVEQIAPTTLAHGTYRYSVDISTVGRWSCSVYDPNGCTWIDSYRQSRTYIFSWNGTKTIVYPAAKPKASSTLSGNRGSASSAEITWAGVKSTPEVQDYTAVATVIGFSKEGGSCVTARTTCQVRNLSAGFIYFFGVVARNSIGAGKAKISYVGLAIPKWSKGSGLQVASLATLRGVKTAKVRVNSGGWSACEVSATRIDCAVSQSVAKSDVEIVVYTSGRKVVART